MTPFFAVVRAHHSPKKNTALAPIATFMLVIAMAAFFLYHPSQTSLEPQVAQQKFVGTNRYMDFPNRSTFPSQYEEPALMSASNLNTDTATTSNITPVLASDLK